MSVLEKISAEIQKVLDKERDFTSENAKAQALALLWVLELFDKYAEQETDINYIGEFCHKHGLVLMSKEMADKYAEQEPCDDAVSRQALVNEFQNTEDAEYCKWSTDGIVSVIKDMPSVQPKANTGRWIDRSEGGRIKYPWMEAYECNECGEYGSAAWKFCPNCGARMGVSE